MGVTHAVLKTIAAFLNTEGGDLLIGIADDGSIVGTERDQLESDDKFMRHLAQVVRTVWVIAPARASTPRPRSWKAGPCAWSAASAARSQPS